MKSQSFSQGSTSSPTLPTTWGTPPFVRTSTTRAARIVVGPVEPKGNLSVSSIKYSPLSSSFFLDGGNASCTAAPQVQLQQRLASGPITACWTVCLCGLPTKTLLHRWTQPHPVKRSRRSERIKVRNQPATCLPPPVFALAIQAPTAFQETHRVPTLPH